MTDTLTPVLTAHWDQPDIFTIDGYRRAGGWQALPKALSMPRGEVIRVVLHPLTISRTDVAGATPSAASCSSRA